MKMDIKKLALCFFLYYIVTDVFRGIINSNSFSEALVYNLQPRIIALTISVGFIFFLFTISSYFIFFKRYNKKPFWSNLLITVLIAILIIFLRYFLEEIIFRHLFGFGNYNKDVSLSYYLIDNFYYAFQYCALGIIFYFWQYSKFKDESNSQLLLEKQQMELDLLRSQTNPHFLFNTLNNIYALIHTNSDKALGAIEKLSSLLRYSLYKTKTDVLLEDEISQIRNFIDLESFRHKEEPNLKLNIEGITKGVRVPQFLLLPFVENAFKHGKLHSHNLPITITLDVTDMKIKYMVTNEIEQKKKDKVGGIGLDNLKKRLELLYPKNHMFLCKAGNSAFTAQLEIPLQ
ncbi:sensor histidine kinase [uncultured Winogradskyella sp.]|uniref:sensor histidine kinase n=1 Tax=uncultured Winogradskyella sp. TaxID=395353 RepID=UPI00262C5E97|nr:histidine kinase [uncultured Winogradskyella sp.]